MDIFNVRSEVEIFNELKQLSTSNGYIYALALMCFKNTFILYKDEYNFETGEKYYQQQDLVRNELSMLISLTFKNSPDIKNIDKDTAKAYIKRTNKLIDELNKLMKNGYTFTENPFESPVMLRHSIFYHQEVAYSFQYQDFSMLKYHNDNEWLITNKGFTAEDAHKIIQSIYHYQIYNGTIICSSVDIKKEPSRSLEIFEISIDEIASDSGLSNEIVLSFLKSFSLFDNVTDELDNYNSVDDFNPYNAYPIVMLNGKYYCFNIYNISEAMYETPFYWFIKDKKYKKVASEHNGNFTEKFVYDSLISVFGSPNTYKNVNIYKKGAKRKPVCEVDVLVIYGKMALIIQAKSKKLTLKSKQGDYDSILSDFTKSFQESYDQSLICSECICSNEFDFYDSNDKRIDIPCKFREIYPISITSSNYPTYSIQARSLLNYKETKVIRPPFVTDIFCFDIISELLSNPLYFLSYINRRVNLNKKIMSSNEYNILGYHLKNNLWFSSDLTLIVIDEDYCIEVDTAMNARRRNLLGKSIPEGILTYFKGTVYDRIITSLSEESSEYAIEVGFLLLSLSSDTVKKLNILFSELRNNAVDNNKSKGGAIGISNEGNILTSMLVIRCCSEVNKHDFDMLEFHCSIHKYRNRLNSIYGLMINSDYDLVSCYIDNSIWKKNDEMEKIADTSIKSSEYTIVGDSIKPIKQGKNSPCNCGSGKKYKLCCGRK